MFSFKKIFTAESMFFMFLFSGAIKIYLPFLPVDFTILSLLLSVGSVGWRVVKKPLVNKNLLIPSIIFICLISVALFSALYSPSYYYASDKLMRLIVFTGWSFLAPYQIFEKEENIKRFIDAGIIICLITALAAIIMSSGADDALLIRAGDENTLGLARLMGVGVILIFFNRILKKGNHPFFNFILVAFPVFVLLSTGSRMPLISLAVSILLGVAIYFRFERGKITIDKKLGIFVFFAGVIAVVVSSLWDSPAFYTLKYRFTSLFETSITSDVSSLLRISRYNTAFDMFKSNVFLGKGFGSFPVFYNHVDVKDYPHNIFLEFLAETGIFGFIVFLTLIIVVFSQVIKFNKHKKLNETQFSIISIMIFFLINANVTGDINDNRVLFAFLSLSAIVVSESLTKKQKIEPLKKLEMYSRTKLCDR